GAVAAEFTDPSACFIAGTLVLAEDGLKPIEQITAGDNVWAFDEATGALALKKVESAFEKRVSIVVELTMGSETVTTTIDHPFWKDALGWTKAGELLSGIRIRTLSGSTEIIDSFRLIKRNETVYNLEVKDFHT